MHSDELVRLLSGLPGTQVTAGAGMVTAYVPAIGDAVQLTADDVLNAEPATVPTGARRSGSGYAAATRSYR